MGVRFSPLAFIALLAAWISAAAAQTDPLPSWNDGPTKQAIVAFVTDVTREDRPTTCRGRSGSPPSTTTARSGSSNRSTSSSRSRWIA